MKNARNRHPATSKRKKKFSCIFRDIYLDLDNDFLDKFKSSENPTAMLNQLIVSKITIFSKVFKVRKIIIFDQF